MTRKLWLGRKREHEGFVSVQLSIKVSFLLLQTIKFSLFPSVGFEIK